MHRLEFSVGGVISWTEIGPALRRSDASWEPVRVALESWVRMQRAILWPARAFRLRHARQADLSANWRERKRWTAERGRPWSENPSTPWHRPAPTALDRNLAREAYDAVMKASGHLWVPRMPVDFGPALRAIVSDETEPRLVVCALLRAMGMSHADANNRVNGRENVRGYRLR